MSAAAPANTRPEISAEVRTLPARYYTDPAWFDRELESIFCDMWLAAGRTEEIQATGSYFQRQVGNARVIVVRDESGAVSAFHNVCRHRGTLLCREPEGRFKGSIQCPYHAWTYGLDGRLTSAPHMEKVVRFRPADFPLQRVATAVWAGHIFINLSPDPSPFSEHLAGLDQRFHPWRMQELVRVERRRYELHANWKLIIQNYSECVHCPNAHPQLSRFQHYLSGVNEPPQATWLGGFMELRPEVRTLSLAEDHDRGCFVHLSETDRRRVYYYAILPNMLLNLHPDYMVTYTLWPRAADFTQVVCEWHFHPSQIRQPGFDASGAIEFWDVTNRQDWELSDLAQLGIASRGYQPGPFSNREELLHAFDRWLLARVPEEPSLYAPDGSD